MVLNSNLQCKCNLISGTAPSPSPLPQQGKMCWFKGTGLQDRIQIFGQKWTDLVKINKNFPWFLNYRNAPLMRCPSLPFLTRFRWQHIGGILFIGDISTEILCGPRCFLLVHCINFWFFVVHCSNGFGRRNSKICSWPLNFISLFIETY